MDQAMASNAAQDQGTAPYASADPEFVPTYRTKEWFRDQTRHHDARKQLSLLKMDADVLFLQRAYEDVLQRCEQAAGLKMSKTQEKEFLELKCRACMALGQHDHALAAAQRRAKLDRGYDVCGARLVAEANLAMKNYADAIPWLAHCLNAQRSNFHLWLKLADCYKHIEGKTAHIFHLCCLIRARAWIQAAANGSKGFVHQAKVDDLAAVEQRLVDAEVPEGEWGEAYLDRASKELIALGIDPIDLSEKEAETRLDHGSTVVAANCRVDRDMFERSWFVTKRRLPVDEGPDDVELPDKGHRGALSTA